MRKFIGKIHLVTGLVSGSMVFVIAVTGCLYAFKDEIETATQPYRLVTAEKKNFLPPSSLQPIAGKELPGKHAHSIVYESPAHAAQVIFYGRDPQYYDIVYLNPYSGEVLKVRNMNEDFFRIVLMGHFYLWLPPEIGQPVTASATLIFVGLLISGIILWWPRTKNGTRQRLQINVSGSWRRKNYDLHSVLGFYICLLAMVLALTGLVWGFEWFAGSAYRVFSGGKKMVRYYEPVSDTLAPEQRSSIPAVDVVWILMQREYPQAQKVEIHFPEQPGSVIAASANPDASTFYKTDYRYFDQLTLKEVSVRHPWGRYGQSNGGDLLLKMNYDVHVGAIVGLPGKTAAFFISLITASLPVTGFLLWWGRMKKKKSKPAASTAAGKEHAYETHR